MMRGHLVLEIAAHLRGAVIDATAMLAIEGAVLHLWGYRTPTGERRAVVVRQIGRTYAGWRAFPGALEDAIRHYRTHPASPAPAQTLSRAA